MSGRLVGMERVVGCRIACSQSVEAAGVVCGHSVCSRTSHCHHVASSRRRQPRLRQLLLLHRQRGTQCQSCGNAASGTCAAYAAAARTTAGGDRRFAYEAIWTQGRRGRHPSQPHARSGRSKIPLRAHLGHAVVGVAASLWGALALPLLAMLYVRKRTIARIPRKRGWKFHTKLQLGAKLVVWMAEIVQKAGKKMWVVVDGFYGKRPFLKPVMAAGVVVVGRLRKDAGLRHLPPKPPPGKRRGPGRPPTYGKKKISLAKRAGQKRGWQQVQCTLYGEVVTKTIKTFLATWHPAAGLIRVVLIKEDDGWVPLFCSDPEASVVDILEAFADRATIEQDFHDVKEVWGAGQQHVRNIWTNVGVFHLNLWMHTLVELWAWQRSHEELCDRSDSPWDDAERRPSHADRRKALRELIIQNEFSAITHAWWLTRKMRQLVERLMNLAA